MEVNSSFKHNLISIFWKNSFKEIFFSRGALFFICTYFSSIAAMGDVELSKTKPLILPAVILEPTISEEVVAEIIPTSVSKTRSSGSVISEIAENLVSYWWKHSPLRNSKIGRAADTIEEKARIQSELIDENNVRHVFDLKIMALQAMAKLEYKGYVNAAINYFPSGEASEAEIMKALSPNSSLSLSKSLHSLEATTKITFQYEW